MAFLDPIGSVLRTMTGSPPATAPAGRGATTRVITPYDAAAHVRTTFAPLFTDTFTSSMSSVLADAASGAFDDAKLAGEAEQLTRRLQQYQAGEGAAAVGVTAGGPTSGVGTARGANAAPTPGTVDPTGPSGAAYVADQRRLLAVNQQQAEHRRQRVAESLPARFTTGAQLPSTLSGGLDPRTFRPANEQQAKALAERLAMDLTIGAAELEVLGTRLDVARFDATHAGGGAAQAAVGALEQQYAARQKALLELARIVDATTGTGQGLADVPAAARAALDAGQVVRVASRARQAGASDADVETITDLQVVVEDEARTGNSSYVHAVAARYTDTLLEQMRRDFREDMERDRQEWQRMMDRRADEAAAQRRAESRAADEQAAAVRSLERKALFAVR